MQLKSIFFLILFLFSIIGPASVSLFADDSEVITIVITEEEQQEDFKGDTKGKKAQNSTSEIAGKHSFIASNKSSNISEKKSFWNCIHSETFYPPPEQA